MPQTEDFARVAQVADGDLLKRNLNRFAMELKRGRQHRHRRARWLRLLRIANVYTNV